MEELQPQQPKKRIRSVRQTKEQTDEFLRKTHHELLRHLGQSVLLFKKENRNMMPYFVYLVKPIGKSGVLAFQRCYRPDGSFVKITHIVNEISILIGEQKVVFFDSI